VAALAGCAQIPRDPIIQQPMTAQPPMPIAMQAPGSIFNPGYAGRPLFEDQRPRNVGDILTIVIAENINATKSSGANTNRQGNTDFNADGRVPRRAVREGEPVGDRREQVRGDRRRERREHVQRHDHRDGDQRAAERQPGGERREADADQPGQRVRALLGRRQPNTISGANSVYSTQVADARIEYSAKGYINEAETMGWLQRFFLNLAPW
jgi:flagellar L-ring protein precursor FlgH